MLKGYVGNWHGGSSYGHGWVWDDTNAEHFRSLEAAKFAMRSREKYGYSMRQTFAGVREDENGMVVRTEDRHDYCPSVDENSYMDLYPIREDGTVDTDVFTRIEFGPRGGLVVNHS